VEDVDQHVVLGHRVDGGRGPEQVDPELLVGFGDVVGQGWWAAERGGPGVEDAQLQGEAAVKLEVPVQDAGAGAVHVGRGCELALGWIGNGEGDVGVAVGGVGWLVAVGVHEPASGAAADGLPTGDRAGLEVLHDHRARLRWEPDQQQAQRDHRDQRRNGDRAPAAPDRSHDAEAVDPIGGTWLSLVPHRSVLLSPC
jgi:hypothetical protein